MTSTKVLAKRHRKVISSGTTGRFGLEPVPWFHHSLRRERARADQTGRDLALVLFTPRQRRADTTNARLARILRRWPLAAEEAGWFDGKRIAVILPEADSDRAWQFADDVCREFPLSVMPPLCEVFCYPDHWPTQESEGADSAKSVAMAGHVAQVDDAFLQPPPAWKRLLGVMGTATVWLLLGRPGAY